MGYYTVNWFKKRKQFLIEGADGRKTIPTTGTIAPDN